MKKKQKDRITKFFEDAAEVKNDALGLDPKYIKPAEVLPHFWLWAFSFALLCFVIGVLVFNPQWWLVIPVGLMYFLAMLCMYHGKVIL